MDAVQRLGQRSGVENVPLHDLRGVIDEGPQLVGRAGQTPQHDGLAYPTRAEQSQSRAVAGDQDAGVSRAVRLEAVEAARVPEQRPGDRGADRESSDEHDYAGGGDLQPPHPVPSSLCARAVCHRDVG